MEYSRRALNLEQTYRDMTTDMSWSDYLGQVSGTAAEWAWSQGLNDWVANGGNANDWYQDMLLSFPEQRQALFDIYQAFTDKYGFSEGTPTNSDMSRPGTRGGTPKNGSPDPGALPTSPWPTNEAAFIAVAVGLLAIAIYALKEK